MDPAPDFFEKLILPLKWALAFGIGQLAGATVGPKAAITALIVFMAIDWITGFTAAWIRGQVSSEIGSKGIAKKFLTLLLILTIHLAEKLSGYEFNLELWGAAGYAINELISIVENMDRAGVYIPQPLVAGLLKVKGFQPPRASRDEIDALRTETRDAADVHLAESRAEADLDRAQSRKEIDEAPKPPGN